MLRTSHLMKLYSGLLSTRQKFTLYNVPCIHRCMLFLAVCSESQALAFHPVDRYPFCLPSLLRTELRLLYGQWSDANNIIEFAAPGLQPW